MKLSIPTDSILNNWAESLSITELPRSYQLATGLSLIGGILRRNLYVDQEKFRIYPNMSMLFVGPSGIGKDVAINQITKVIRDLYGRTTPRLIESRTIEKVFTQLASYGDCAAAWILAPELTAFLGGRDYQKSMVQDLTNLLSTNDVLDASIKSEQRIINRPTICMLAGSTADWLQRAMPEGSMEGGFIPRFLVFYEEYPSRHIPLIKHGLSKFELFEAKAHYARFKEELSWVLNSFTDKHPQECILTDAAKDLYVNWYCGRFERYSPTIREYANRSRDQILRIAMVCGVSRGRNYIDDIDVQFAIDLMDYIGDRIELAIRPMSKDNRICAAIEQLLPATTGGIVRNLRKSFSQDEILRTLATMKQTNQIKQQEEGAPWYIS